MRPLFHPAMEDVTVEAILHALSDPMRLAICVDITRQECTQNCSSFLSVEKHDIPKSTLSQHFKVLRESGLIRGERIGVEMHNASRCSEIDKRFPGLLQAILKAHAIQSDDQARRKKATARQAAKRTPKAKGGASSHLRK